MRPSAPSARAWAICWRSVSRLSSAPAASMPPPSPTPSRTAAISVARKKKRSKTRSKILRSSWDLASVAASASRKSSWPGPLHLAQDAERVEQLARAHRDALAAQLLAELEQAGGEALRRLLGRGLRCAARRAY